MILGGTDQQYADKTSLHLFEGDAIFNADNLIAQWNGILQALQYDIR